MRTFLRTIGVAAFGFGFAACNSAPSSPVPSIANNALVRAEAFASEDRMQPAGGLPDLYVADDGAGSILKLKNSDYSPDGTITDGINGPLDVSLDGSGNLFVANATGVNVTEYPPGASSPSFTYSTGMVEPLFVINDAHGNVYEVDSANPDGVGDNDGFVNEYAPQTNTVLHSCAPGAHPTGIAIDGKGDIFLALNSSSAHGRVVEYKRGLNGCKATTLGLQLGFVVGIALDMKANLIATDYDRSEVYVFAPPYTKIMRRLGHGGRESQPYHVSINGSNSLVYVTNFSKGGVFIVDYASGKVIRRVDGDAGTFDGPHAVY
jgi:DNA-binding beta-propeller fold protein YncE